MYVVFELGTLMLFLYKCLPIIPRSFKTSECVSNYKELPKNFQEPGKDVIDFILIGFYAILINDENV